MTLFACRECAQPASFEAFQCPHCGAPNPTQKNFKGWGFEWKSKATLFGVPLVHVAIGRDKNRKLRVAKGIVAIGQFAVGIFTIAQFGLSLFGFGQFLAGIAVLAQFAGGAFWSLGQFSTGVLFAFGQFAVGNPVVGQFKIPFEGPVAMISAVVYSWLLAALIFAILRRAVVRSAPSAGAMAAFLAEGPDDETLSLSPPQGRKDDGEPLPLKPGATFHGVEILDLIGRGGMGVVYRARHISLNRPVAVKILSPKLATDPEFARRFDREARAMAALDHPNIVRVHDYGREGDLYFLTMEFVDGVSLRDLLRERRLAPAEALRIVPQICEALEVAHAEGVVHRDIKPENILVDRKGRVKIADFGLAKMHPRAAETSPLTQTEVVMGTPDYMAPEQRAAMRNADHRADIYSLGVVFYEMLTGELPVGNFLPPSRKIEVDVRLDEIVLKALAREPERRYQCAAHVRTDLETILMGGTPDRNGKIRYNYAMDILAVALYVMAISPLMDNPLSKPSGLESREGIGGIVLYIFASFCAMAGVLNAAKTRTWHRLFWLLPGSLIILAPFIHANPIVIETHERMILVGLFSGVLAGMSVFISLTFRRKQDQER